MMVIEVLRIALSGLQSNKLRSFLTVLGVVIGVTAVIVMVAIGEGAKSRVTENIQGLGSNLLIITPGREGDRQSGFGASGSGGAIDLALSEYLKENCLLCLGVSPEASQNMTVRGPKTAINSSIVGVTPDYLSARNHSIALGEFFTEADLEWRRRVAILGSSVAEEIFPPGVDPVGQYVKIGNVRFEVGGVLASKGQSGFMNIDDQVLVPITTAQRRLYRNQRLRAIYLQVADAKLMNQAKAEVNALLMEKLGNPNAYVLNSQADMVSAMEDTMNTFTLLLAGIAGVSLLVGGIGIMNIMLVSVTERVREIGIRKAVGAKRREILLQFLSEAIALSLTGGVIGILLGIFGARMLAHYGGWRAIVSLNSIILAVGYSFCIGLFFGVYPANKASRLQPVEALRHE